MTDTLTEQENAVVIRRFDRMIRDLYFSPKKRTALKKYYLTLLRQMKSYWPMIDQLPEESRDMLTATTALSSSMLTNIEDAELWSRGRFLKNKKFTLWKHIFRHEYLVVFTFFKVSEGIHKQATVVFPNGLPKTGTLGTAYFYRHTFTTKEHREILQGTFFQKFLEVDLVAYTLKGSGRTIRFLLNDQNRRSPEVTACALPRRKKAEFTKSETCE